MIVEHDFFCKMVPNWVYFGQGENFKLTTKLWEKVQYSRNQAIKNGLRWPNTVLARAFTDANLHVHKDFKKQTCRLHCDHFIYSRPAISVLFFSIIACSVLMALVFYYNDMLQQVTMQRTQHF